MNVERLFLDLRVNNDKQARKLATELLESVEVFTAPAPGLLDLPPLPREYGEDINSGLQEKRLWEGGTSPRTDKDEDAARAS
jgi:hypothetical protein